MKRIIIYVLSYWVCLSASAQSDSITLRDEWFLIKDAIPDLINEYHSRLSVIGDNSMLPDDIMHAIDVMINKANVNRIFFDSNVIIENDLNAGAEVAATPEDKKVKDYLEEFNLFVKKGENFSVSFSGLQISPLKKSSFLYFNVYFETEIQGEDFRRQLLPASHRKAEIRLVRKNSQWHAYINGIKFAPAGAYDERTDSIHLFDRNLFLTSVSDTMRYDVYVQKVREEYRKKQQAEQASKLINILLEAKDALAGSELEKAKKIIREARKLNADDKEVIALQEQIDIAIEIKNKKKKEKEETEAQINNLIRKAADAFDAYDFSLSAQLYDSLSMKYGLPDDTVKQKSKELADIISVLESIHNAIREKRFDEAIKRCEKNLTPDKNPKLRAECYYLEALIYFKQDNSNRRKIFEFLDKAITTSGKKHGDALTLQVKMCQRDKRFDDAIQDASWLITTYSREPKYYALRADVHESNNNREFAIADYTKAILLGTADSNIYVAKSRLEYETGKYDESIKTAVEILEKTKWFSDAFYYRALSNYKLNKFSYAGKDFYLAVGCGLDKDKVANFRSVSGKHFESGKKYYEQSDYFNSYTELSNSIVLDSNSAALFLRSKIFLGRGTPSADSAEADLSVIIRHEPESALAKVYYQRGILRADKNDFVNAVGDFKKELDLYRESEEPYIKDVYLRKAGAEIRMKKYFDAGMDYEAAGKKFKDDFSFRSAAEAYFKADSINKIIEVTTAAENLRIRKTEIFIWRGRAYFYKGYLQKAKEDFENVLAMDKVNADAGYWLGRVLVEYGKFEEALSYLERAILPSLSSEFAADAYYYRGYAKIKYGLQNLAETAARDFTMAMNLNPGNYQTAETNSWIAFVHLKLHNASSAKEYLEKARVKDSRNHIFNYASACYSAAVGSYDVSMQFLQKALASSKFTKNEIDDEQLLQTLRSDRKSKSRFKDIMKKYFQ